MTSLPQSKQPEGSSEQSGRQASVPPSYPWLTHDSPPRSAPSHASPTAGNVDVWANAALQLLTNFAFTDGSAATPVGSATYDIQLTTAPVTDGSLSSCPPAEAVTWGKYQS